MHATPIDFLVGSYQELCHPPWNLQVSPWKSRVGRWNFLSGWHILRGYVSFRECIPTFSSVAWTSSPMIWWSSMIHDLLLRGWVYLCSFFFLQSFIFSIFWNPKDHELWFHLSNVRKNSWTKSLHKVCDASNTTTDTVDSKEIRLTSWGW